MSVLLKPHLYINRAVHSLKILTTQLEAYQAVRPWLVSGHRVALSSLPSGMGKRQVNTNNTFADIITEGSSKSVVLILGCKFELTGSFYDSIDAQTPPP